jgi:hypothetical protein
MTLPFRKGLDAPWSKWTLFTIGAAAIFLRSPRLFFQPRFWAEEGSIFFTFAFQNPALTALLRPDGGNYDFPRNLASVLAVNLAPLDWAPLVTTLFSFAIQLIPLLLILDHSLLKSTFRQVIAIAFYLFAATSDEIWLTTLHSQRYLSVAAFLVLLDESDPGRPLKIWLHRLLLLVAGLAGPETVLLGPVFLVKCFLDRRRENIVQAGVVSACAALQFAIFILFPSETSRFYPLDLRTFSTIIWTKNIMLPLFGWKGIKPFRWAYLHFPGVWGQILGIGLLLAEIWILYALVRRIRSRDSILILGSFVLTTVFSIAFMIGEKGLLVGEYGGNRYFYAPNFMLGILVLLNFDMEGITRRRYRFWRALLILMLAMGAFRFRHLHEFFTRWEVPWKQEVATWRQNPQYPLRIWPEGWESKLGERK